MNTRMVSLCLSLLLAVKSGAKEPSSVALGSHPDPRRWFFPNTTLAGVHPQSDPPEHDGELSLSTTEIFVLPSTDQVLPIPPTSTDFIDEADSDPSYSQNSEQDQAPQHSSIDSPPDTNIRPPEEGPSQASRPIPTTTGWSKTISSPLASPAPGVTLGSEASTKLSGLSSEYRSIAVPSSVAQDTTAFPAKPESLVSSRAVGSELTTPVARPVVVAPESSSSQNYESQNSYLSAWPFSTAISVKHALAQELQPQTTSVSSPGSAKESTKGVSSAQYLSGSNAGYTQTTSPQSSSPTDTSVSDGESLPTPQSTEAEMSTSPPNERPDSSTAPTHGVGPANDALDAGDHGHSSAEKRASNAGVAIGAVLLGAAVGLGVFFGAKRRQKCRWDGFGHMASSNSSSSTLDFRCAGTDSQHTLKRPCSE